MLIITQTTDLKLSSYRVDMKRTFRFLSITIYSESTISLMIDLFMIKPPFYLIPSIPPAWPPTRELRSIAVAPSIRLLACTKD